MGISCAAYRPKPETLKRRSIERKLNSAKGNRGAARFGRREASNKDTHSTKKGAPVKKTFSSKTSGSSSSTSGRAFDQKLPVGKSTSKTSSGSKSPFSRFGRTGASSSSIFRKGPSASSGKGQSGKTFGSSGSFGKFDKGPVPKLGKKRGLGLHKSFK